MNIFRQRKNKRFSYIPRHLRESDNNSEENIKEQWNAIRKQGKRKGRPRSNLVMLLVVLGMIIVVWFILNHYEIS